MKALSRTAIAAAALAVALVLSACSASSPSTVPVPDKGYGIANGSAANAPGAAPAADGGSQSTVDRSIVTTGTATILVTDPAKAADAAASIAEGAGGRVDARDEQAPTDYDGGSASLTLRIPASGLSAALDALKALGTPQSIALNSNDVTMQVNDLDAQVNALQTAITRLTALMAQATSTADLITIEDAITDRQGQLDSLRAQQRTLQDQVAMSTMTVSFVTEAVKATPAPVTFWDGLGAGWSGLGAFAGGLLIALGAFIPWLIPIAIVGGIVWLIVWLQRRRRRRPTAPPAPVAPTT